MYTANFPWEMQYLGFSLSWSWLWRDMWVSGWMECPGGQVWRTRPSVVRMRGRSQIGHPPSLIFILLTASTLGSQQIQTVITGDLVHALLLRILWLSCALWIYVVWLFREKRNRNIYSFAILFNLTWNMEGWLLHCPGRGPPWPVSCLHLNPDTDGSCVQSRSQ